MGCISPKNKTSKQTEQLAHSLQIPVNDNSKKYDGILRTDACSTIATFQLTGRSKISRRSSFIRPSQKITFGNYIGNFITQTAFKTDRNIIKIAGPGLDGKFYDILCQQQNIPFYLQLLYGFPTQNIYISQVKSDQTFKNNQRSKFSMNQHEQKPTYYFILKDEVKLFLKFLIQCPTCYKLTIATKSKTLFNLDFSNCQCNQQRINISIIKKQPYYIKIWSDETQKFILDEQKQQQIQKIKKKDKLRIIGCSSCWSFKNLQKRNRSKQFKGSCSCSICKKCQLLKSGCEVCQQ